MDDCNSETWRFTTRPGPADKVYLVMDGPTSPSRWVEMRPVAGDPGLWLIDAEIAPGRTRVRYFTALNGAYLNCGTAGLYGERTSERSPAVCLEDLGVAAWA